MKSKTISGLLLISTLLFVVGCAQNEAVKKEEPLIPAAAQTPVTAKKEPLSQTNITPTTAATAESTTKTNQAAAVASAASSQNRSVQQSTPAALFFDFDAYILTNESRGTLQSNFKLLESKPSVQIEGHCDERGSSEYNLALGEKRAKAAQNYLVTLGYPAEKLSTISYGKERPAVKGSDEDSWAKNRRDEFKIVK